MQTEQLVIRVNEVHPEWSQEQWMERGRGWWKTKPTRALFADHIIVVDRYDIARASGVIWGMQKEPGGTRISLICDPDESRNLFTGIGQEIERSTSMNPVNYIAAEAPNDLIKP